MLIDYLFFGGIIIGMIVIPYIFGVKLLWNKIYLRISIPAFAICGLWLYGGIQDAITEYMPAINIFLNSLAGVIPILGLVVYDWIVIESDRYEREALFS